MGSALKQQMYKRGAGFIWLQCTVLFHSHYQLETDKLQSCSGTKCDVVRLSPTRRAASGMGWGGRWRRPLAVVWDRLKSCGSQHAATTLSWLFPPVPKRIAGWGVFFSTGRGLGFGEREKEEQKRARGGEWQIREAPVAGWIKPEVKKRGG